MKKILILYTSIGQGHKSIAENIAWYLERAGFEVKLLDALKQQNRKIDKLATKIYQNMVQWFPFVWSWLYTSKLVHALAKPLRVPLAGGSAKKILKVISEFSPDMIITTQITASAAVSGIKARGLYNGIFVIALHDYHFHHMWTFDNADGYLACITEQKTEMMNLGIAGEKIFVCGMVTKPKREIDTKVLRENWNFEPTDKVILVSAGSQGFRLPTTLLSKLGELSNTKVIIICGKNEALEVQLEQEFRNQRQFKIFGFYSPMEEMYALADVFVTKPGGMTVAEALQYNLPMFITHSLPGQEQINMEYLVAKKLVVDLEDLNFSEIVKTVEGELQTGSQRQVLMNNPNKQKIVGDLAGEIEVVKTIKSLFHYV